MQTKAFTRIFSCLIIFGNIAAAQININTLPYNSGTTDFNSFNPSSASNLSSTIPTGWSASSSGTAAYRGTGTGTSNSGGYWGYGSSSDFSLGALRSSSVGAISYSVDFLNNSGSTIGSIQLSWDYKQFRFANASGWDCSGTGALASNSTLDAKDFTGSSSGTNGTPVTTTVSPFTLTGLSIANNASFGISWTTTDDLSADNGVSIDNFSIKANNNPLPIRISSLQILSNTASGTAFRCFIESSLELRTVVLERSMDGLNFKAIKTFNDVNRQNFSTEIVDSKPMAIWNIYRLKMIDIAGNENFSTTQVVHTDLSLTAPVQLFPNPCGDQLTVTLPGNNQTKEVSILNMLGQEIQNLKTDQASLQIGMEGLPTGQYFLRIKEGGVMQTIGFGHL